MQYCVVNNNKLKYQYLSLGTSMSHKTFSDPSEVIALYESGKTLQEIADLFGTVKSTVKNTLKRAGVSLRSLSESKKGKPSSFKGHIHSEETRAKMRANHADFSGINHPRYGHKDIVGQKNPNWQGGIGNATNIGRNTVQNLNWKRKVLEADNYICTLCFSKNRRTLITHHIEGWVQAPEKRHDVQNGICLCRSCHASIHAKGSEKFANLFKEHVKLRSL